MVSRSSQFLRSLATLAAMALPTLAVATGPLVTTLATPQEIPSRGRLGGVTIDGSGNIYVANFSATVWRRTPAGDFTVLANGFQGSSGNAMTRAGDLLQASFVDGRIVRISPDGAVTDVVSGGLRGPVGLIETDDGSVLVCECQGNAIARIATDGEISEFASGGDLDCPNGIAQGPDGAWYVTSFKDEYITRIDHDGRMSRFSTVPGGTNAHIVFAAGAFWVTKIEKHTLSRVAVDGRATHFAGTGLLGFDDGPASEATFAYPNGVAATPDGRALVIDTLRGERRGEEETQIVLRRIELPPRQDQLEQIRIPVGDFVFDAVAAGPPDGELVLLLHGFPQTGCAFEQELRALAAAGYRAVAPDQRGYSPDARPTAVEAYSMGHLVSDVMGMADRLGRERFHLVGHDWGGAVAWVAATRFPERVATLSVLSTPHFAAFSAELRDPGSEQSERSSYFSDFAAEDAAEKMLAQDGRLLREILSALPKERQDLYNEHFSSVEALQGPLSWYRAAAPPRATEGSPPPSRPARSPSPITTPTLYVWGEEDAAFGPAAVEATAEFVAGPYEFHALVGVGHWLPELAAESITPLILAQLQRGKSDPTLDGYVAARRVLDAAVKALGQDAVLGFRNLEIEYEAEREAIGQSRKPGPPFDLAHATGTFLYEHGGRISHEEQFVNGGGTDRSFRRVLLDDGGWNLWTSRELLTEVSPSDAARLRGWALLNMQIALPHSLLLSALESPKTLRWLGEGNVDQTEVARVSFEDANGSVATLAVDRDSGLPVSVTRLGSDRLLGDVSNGVHFEDYRLVEGLQIPHRLIFTVNGRQAAASRLSELRLNQELEESRFARPDDVELAPQPPRFAPQELAPGVYAVRLYAGPGNSYSSMLVEFEDHIVVIEAPLVGAFFPAFQQIARSIAPDKPIRAVVTTHHHHDHAGGAARFLAAGIDVITTPDAVKVIETMRRARHSLGPSLPSGDDGKLIAVADSLVLSDTTRRLRLIQVGPSPHVEQILVAQLPDEKILYVADLFAVPESRFYPAASPTVRHFADLVHRFDLGFETVVPTHGLVGSRKDFEAALAK